MDLEDTKQRIRDRKAMTQAERWLTKKNPRKQGSGSLGTASFNEKIRDQTNIWKWI